MGASPALSTQGLVAGYERDLPIVRGIDFAVKPGELVVQLDEERVRNVDHLMQMIGNAMAGTGIHLTVVRDDQSLEFDVLLGRRPDALDQR